MSFVSTEDFIVRIFVLEWQCQLLIVDANMEAWEWIHLVYLYCRASNVRANVYASTCMIVISYTVYESTV